MVPLLLDEGVPPVVAEALRTLGLSVTAVGDDDGPARGSTDFENAKWCAENGAVMVTNDRGRKDRAILDALAQEHVHALFVYRDLLEQPPHRLAGALLGAEERIAKEVAKPKGLLRHRLRPAGGLEKR